MRVFAHVDAGISRLAGWLRLAYSAVFMVAITELTGALRLLGEGGHLSVFTTDQLHAQALLRIEAFTSVFDAALVCQWHGTASPLERRPRGRAGRGAPLPHLPSRRLQVCPD
ncbi:MAG: hypothetical protein M3423_10045 [Actinomycetota bacterium]|nr:hypothetical protein [Actinomycetota bacterium]